MTCQNLFHGQALLRNFLPIWMAPPPVIVGTFINSTLPSTLPCFSPLAWLCTITKFEQCLRNFSQMLHPLNKELLSLFDKVTLVTYCVRHIFVMGRRFSTYQDMHSRISLYLLYGKCQRMCGLIIWDMDLTDCEGVNLKPGTVTVMVGIGRHAFTPNTRRLRLIFYNLQVGYDCLALSLDW